MVDECSETELGSLGNPAARKKRMLWSALGAANAPGGSPWVNIGWKPGIHSRFGRRGRPAIIMKPSKLHSPITHSLTQQEVVTGRVIGGFERIALGRVSIGGPAKELNWVPKKRPLRLQTKEDQSKNTLRWMRGEDLFRHLGLEYYD